MYYLFVATMFACALYQEAVPDYFELFYTYRSLFDALMGSYSYSVYDNHKATQEYSYTIFMFIHIYIAKIFLLNYLITIFSTVYGDMTDIGEFFVQMQ